MTVKVDIAVCGVARTFLFSPNFALCSQIELKVARSDVRLHLCLRVSVLLYRLGRKKPERDRLGTVWEQTDIQTDAQEKKADNVGPFA